MSNDKKQGLPSPMEAKPNKAMGMIAADQKAKLFGNDEPVKSPEVTPAKEAPKVEDKWISVRATSVGFYGRMRIKPGDIFKIRNKSEFSKFWMELV